MRAARRAAYFAVLTAAAAVLSAVESLVPVPVPAPGVKLGLANSVTLFVLYKEKKLPGALGVTAARCAIAALAAGSFSSLLFSLSGGLFSCVIMWLLLHYNFALSAVGVSAAGAVSHNAAQLAAASLFARDPAILSYAPVLTLFGTAAGCATGYIYTRIDIIMKTNRNF